MQISIEEAANQLSILVRQVQQGEEVVLLQDGEPSVRLVPAPAHPSRKERYTPEELDAILDRIRAAAPPRSDNPADSAARSQDFLYDEDGIPA